MGRAYLTEDNKGRQSRVEGRGYLLVSAYKLLGPASPEVKTTLESLEVYGLGLGR